MTQPCSLASKASIALPSGPAWRQFCVVFLSGVFRCTRRKLGGNIYPALVLDEARSPKRQQMWISSATEALRTCNCSEHTSSQVTWRLPALEQPQRCSTQHHVWSSGGSIVYLLLFADQVVSCTQTSNPASTNIRENRSKGRKRGKQYSLPAPRTTATAMTQATTPPMTMPAMAPPLMLPEPWGSVAPGGTGGAALSAK